MILRTVKRIERKQKKAMGIIKRDYKTIKRINLILLFIEIYKFLSIVLAIAALLLRAIDINIEPLLNIVFWPISLILYLWAQCFYFYNSLQYIFTLFFSVGSIVFILEWINEKKLLEAGISEKFMIIIHIFAIFSLFITLFYQILVWTAWL